MNLSVILSFRNNSCFFQYLENEWTEFNQILYTNYQRQGLLWDCNSHFSQIWNRVTALIGVRIQFLFNIFGMNGQNVTKFCIHIIIDKIYVCSVNRHFSQIYKRVTALDLRQNLVFFSIS